MLKGTQGGQGGSRRSKGLLGDAGLASCGLVRLEEVCWGWVKLGWVVILRERWVRFGETG